MNQETLEQICKDVFNKLGNSHSECVYQKALCIELNNHDSIHTVESEKYIPVMYTCSRGYDHTIGMERIDILARCHDGSSILMELKAHSSGIRDNTEIRQIKKYIESLKYMNIFPSLSVIVNFPQNCKSTEVEFYYYLKVIENNQ